jgi:hypothetical protein
MILDAMKEHIRIYGTEPVALDVSPGMTRILFEYQDHYYSHLKGEPMCEWKQFMGVPVNWNAKDFRLYAFEVPSKEVSSDEVSGWATWFVQEGDRVRRFVTPRYVKTNCPAGRGFIAKSLLEGGAGLSKELGQYWLGKDQDGVREAIQAKRQHEPKVRELFET